MTYIRLTCKLKIVEALIKTKIINIKYISMIKTQLMMYKNKTYFLLLLESKLTNILETKIEK